MPRILPPILHLAPFVARDIREQYAGSRLGLIWALLQPALLVLLYWWVFAQIMQLRVPARPGAVEDLPFIAFLLSGLLPWFAFSEGLSRGAAAVVARRDVVTKLPLPSQLFPLSAVSAAFVTHIFAFLLFLIGFFFWKRPTAFGPLVAIGLVLGLQLLTTAGLALVFAALTVYLRDTQQVLTFALQLIFYTAPILYPLELVPETLRALLQINPFAGFAIAYHETVLWGQWPSLALLTHLGLLAVGSFLLGRFVFRRLQPGFSDVL